MKIGFRMPVALALVSGACFANAGITAMAYIPIADVLGHREVVAGYNAYGNENKIDKKIYHYGYVCVGVGDFAEIAYGDDFEKGQTVHAKFKLIEGDNYMLSAGAMNMGERKGIEADWFVAGRYDYKNVRFHAGYLKDNEHRAFFGADFPRFRRLHRDVGVGNGAGCLWLGFP